MLQSEHEGSQKIDTVQCSAILMRYRMQLTVSDVICMCYCSNVRRTYKTNTSSYITGNTLSSKHKGSYCNGQNDDCWAKAEDGRSRTAEAACTAHVPLHRGSYALATSCDCCQAPDDRQSYMTILRVWLARPEDSSSDPISLQVLYKEKWK